jgi:hypothetical protein
VIGEDKRDVRGAAQIAPKSTAQGFRGYRLRRVFNERVGRSPRVVGGIGDPVRINRSSVTGDGSSFRNAASSRDRFPWSGPGFGTISGLATKSFATVGRGIPRAACMLAATSAHCCLLSPIAGSMSGTSGGKILPFAREVEHVSEFSDEKCLRGIGWRGFAFGIGPRRDGDVHSGFGRESPRV